jgi:hypothetical protein
VRGTGAWSDGADLTDATIADATLSLMAAPPKKVSAKALDALASRGRSLLARGTGRATIYQLGSSRSAAMPPMELRVSPRGRRPLG